MRRAATLGLALAACASPPALAPRDLDAPARMVLTERWRGGGRLIVVDETGDRLAPLLVPGTTATGELAVDEHPAFSPDGAWIVFASSRDRDDGRTSLWLAPTRPGARPHRLTDGPWADVDPTWSPAGDAIIFASDRGATGTIDLHRLALVRSGPGWRPAGAPTPLTDGPEHELAPSLVADRLVLQVVAADGSRSWIAERQPDGSLVALTAGPADGAPALSPVGGALAYVAATLREGGERDLDVVVLDAMARERPGLALPGSDEGSPAWSVDGRWLFVTSVVRDDDGAPLLSSVIHVDTWARPGRVRMLRDVAGAAPRLGPALAPVVLDQAELGRNFDHAFALRLALEELAASLEQARPRPRRDDAVPSPP